MRRALLLAVAAFALAAGPAGAGPNLVIGAAENAVVSADEATVSAQLGLATAAGLDAVRVAVPWNAGQTTPDPSALAAYTTTARQAALGGIRLYFEVYPSSADAAPRDDGARAAFVEYVRQLALALPQVRDWVIGSQVNNPSFWPQGATAARDYVALLGASYDALKGIDPGIQVIGGALNAQAAPGTYILAMGKAYRSSGRATPLMDALAIQPSNASSSQPPTLVHPTGETTIGDYSRLVANLKRAFGSTVQAGATLPIVYDGYGVQTEVPPEKAGLYTATENDAVPESTQADYYTQALQLAACQPNVVALLFQHTVDERDLTGWQSGLYYPDLSPKSDFEAVKAAVANVRSGAAGSCSTPTPSPGPAPRPGQADPPVVTFDTPNAATIACSSDCYYVAVLERDANGVPVAARQGRVLPSATLLVSFPTGGLAPGDYRISVHAAARQSPDAAAVAEGDPFPVG